MSIVKFSNGSPRLKIGFLEAIPRGASRIFKASGYKCIALGKTFPPKDEVLWELDCLILMQNIANPKDISRVLKTYAPLLMPRDVRIYILPASQKESIGLQLYRNVITAIEEHQIPNSGFNNDIRERFNEWDEGPSLTALGPFAHVLDGQGNWAHIANIIRSNPASAAPRPTLEVIGQILDDKEKELRDEAMCLVRRAFFDCESVELVALGNGLSGVYTYRAYIQLSGNQVGRGWPYVYFVKLGKRKTIATESRKYEANVMDHVPHHLGPRLRRDRCALGYKLGIIVTDYVHAAETLRDCARDGRAGAAIGNLFSHTLRNWRNSAKDEDYDIRKYLTEIIANEVPDHRNKAINKFGATKSRKELGELLLRSESKPTMMGVIHNDLHATNVLVRANDAILIDFEKLEESGPLLYDVASLEASLFTDGFVGDKRKPLELLLLIDSLYTLDALDWKFPEFNCSDRSAWFFECVRLVRMHAREMQLSNRQYALVLAAVLLKKSCKENNFDKLDKVDKTEDLITREQTRALAYVLAEKIILLLSNSTAAKEAK